MIEQTIIVLCGATAILLSQDHRHNVRRWACIFGMCSQPAWYIASWRAHQWGIFAISFVYTAAWLRGVYVYWIGGRTIS